MNFRYMIYEIEPNAYILLRQNIHSEIWHCEEACGRTARGTAELAHKNGLTEVYPTMHSASAAALTSFPEINYDAELLFESAIIPMTGKIVPADHGNQAFVLAIDASRPAMLGRQTRYSKLRF